MTSPNNGNTAPNQTERPIQDQPWVRVVPVQLPEHSELAGIHPDMPLHSIHSWSERVTNRMRGENGTVYRKPLSGREYRRLEAQEAELPAAPDGYETLEKLESEIPRPITTKGLKDADGNPIETKDERLWRTAVVYTLSKSALDPDALRKYLINKYDPEFANADHDDQIEKLVIAMQERKIIKGMGGYRGFQVIARHDTSPEALRTVAAYFAERRTEGPRETLKGKKDKDGKVVTKAKIDLIDKEYDARKEEYVARALGGAVLGRKKKETQAEQKAEEWRNNASGQVVDEIRGQLHEYWGDLIEAERDLGISIPNLQILTKQLAQRGFLKIPVLDMGERFDDDDNAKVAKDNSRYEVSTHKVILEGDIRDPRGMQEMRDKLVKLFTDTRIADPKAPQGRPLYNSNRYKTRNEVEKDKADKAKVEAEAAEQARQAAEQARIAAIQAHEAAEEQRRKDEAAEAQRKHDEMVAAINAQTAATQAQADALKAQATAAQNAANATRIATAAEAAARKRQEETDQAAREQAQEAQRQHYERREQDLRDFMATTLGAMAAQNAANPASEHGGTGAGKGQVIEVDEHGQVKFVNEQ